MEEDKTLANIVQKLPPPPPIRMRVEDYIDFLDTIKSDPELQNEVLGWIEEYNTVCTEAGVKLGERLEGVSLKK
jgi:hypothetical protein